MAADPSLRLVLAPLSDENRIAGRLCDERGEEHRFSSWLGLLSLLDAARARTCPGRAPSHASKGS